MTVCDIRISKDGCSLDMSGHATGSEQVCAACSALAFALAGYLVNADSHLTGKPDILLADGGAHIRCQGDSIIRECFKLIGIGLLQIEAQNPKFCSVEMCES